MEVAVEETQSFLCYPTPNQTTRESWSGPLENHRFFKIYSVLLNFQFSAYEVYIYSAINYIVRNTNTELFKTFAHSSWSSEGKQQF